MERKKSRGSEKSWDLCSLHECVANKSSFRWQIITKRWKMRKYCRRTSNKKRVPTNRQWRKPGEDGKSKRSHFYRKNFRPGTLNQLNFLWSGYRHKFNFCFPISLPTSHAKARDWKHFLRKASFSPSSINCQTFFIIGMERRFFMPNREKRKKANFCCFGVKT